LLEEDHAMLAAAFEAVATGLCLLDADGGILRADPALCEMLGYTHGELCGQRCTVIAPLQVAALGARFLATLPPM
jgi:PAS domain S-box-containing protein